MTQIRIFPAEVTSGVPRVILTGRQSVIVEQHRGLMRCEPEGISLNTSSGVLTVSGCGLSLQKYTNEEAVVFGRISSVSMDEEEGRRL